jgi:hypothetical protein
MPLGSDVNRNINCTLHYMYCVSVFRQISSGVLRSPTKKQQQKSRYAWELYQAVNRGLEKPVYFVISSATLRIPMLNFESGAEDVNRHRLLAHRNPMISCVLSTGNFFLLHVALRYFLFITRTSNVVVWSYLIPQSNKNNSWVEHNPIKYMERNGNYFETNPRSCRAVQKKYTGNLKLCLGLANNNVSMTLLHKHIQLTSPLNRTTLQRKEPYPLKFLVN